MTWGPSGLSRNSNSVTIPKLPPPPRTPQNRSAFSCSLARTNSPSAVIRSTESRLSMVSPNRRIVNPMPPPRVSPARPVCETKPAGTTSPNAWVSRSSSPSSTPAWARTDTLRGVHLDALHRGEIDDHPSVAYGVAGEAVAAASNGHEETVLPGEAEGRGHVRRSGAARDQRGEPVDRPVPHPPVLVVAGIGGSNELTTKDGRQPLGCRVIEPDLACRPASRDAWFWADGGRGWDRTSDLSRVRRARNVGL